MSDSTEAASSPVLDIRRRPRHHPPQPAEASEPAAERGSRRTRASCSTGSRRIRDPGAGADRHGPRLLAGYDLNSVADRATSAREEQSAGSAFEVVVNRLEDLGVPTICRLNGGVYGGSTDLALACDFRIGVDTAEMFMPAARLGLHYYKSGIERYVTRLGVDNAKKLFLTAQKIDAPEMLRIGYLTAMCRRRPSTRKSASSLPSSPATHRWRCAA
jgi:1,4-dihydroxy-2-naphthoyl-CoA synthase